MVADRQPIEAMSLKLEAMSLKPIADR